MPTVNQNLDIVRGNNKNFNVTVITQDGSPVDITGGTVRMTVKWAPTDADVSAIFALSSSTSGITLTDPTNGVFTVNIPASATSTVPYRLTKLVYDIQLTTSGSEVFTILRGFFTVVPNITRTTP